jgi:hypothetical protein
VLNCTWDDQEAEIVLRKLNLPLEEQQKLRYLKLREEFSQKGQTPQATGAENKSE